MEYTGAIISNIKGWRMKKALFLVGAGDTGKSQLLKLIQRLIGTRNYSAVDLSDLEVRFGTSRIYGKRLAGSADCSFLTISELRAFKKITGGDQLSAEFKGENGFEFTYDGLLMFCCNELPKFGGDNGQHVYNRLLAVKTGKSIPAEQQDRQLIDKMYAEREGVVYQAVMAVRALITRGYMFGDDCVAQNVLEWQTENNSVLNFYQECCEDRPVYKGKFSVDDGISCGVLYRFYTAWAKQQQNRGYYVGAKEFRKYLITQTKGGIEPVLHTAKNDFYFCTLSVRAYSEYKGYIGKDGFSDIEMDVKVRRVEASKQLKELLIVTVPVPAEPVHTAEDEIIVEFKQALDESVGDEPVGEPAQPPETVPAPNKTSVLQRPPLPEPPACEPKKINMEKLRKMQQRSLAITDNSDNSDVTEDWELLD